MSAERFHPFRRWAPHLVVGIALAILFACDQPVYEAIRGFRTPFLDWLTERVSNLRGAAFPILVGLCLVLIGALRARTRIWRAGTALLLSVALSGGIVSVLKPTFARSGPGGDSPRKPGESWIDARYGRFPSSHAALLFSAATSLSTFLPYTAPAAYGIAVLVCHERVYHGTHFPTDILAGAWVGTVTALLVVGWLARRESWRSDISPFWLNRLRKRGKGESASGEQDETRDEAPPARSQPG
jgi:undecaprenyl-diphosphatase